MLFKADKSNKLQTISGARVQPSVVIFALIAGLQQIDEQPAAKRKEGALKDGTRSR